MNRTKAKDKTKKQLIDEVAELRQGIAELEKLETQHKQAEETLRQEQEKYRTILENIQEGYYEVDLAGNFTFFNDSLCRFLGYSKEELMGMNNRQYTDPERAKRLFQVFNQVYRTGKPPRGFDWKIIRKDGSQRTVQTFFSLQKDSSGHPVGFRGTVRDITKRKKVEATLRRSEETAKRLAIENAIIAKIGRIVSSTLNIEEIYEHFAEEVKKLIPFDRIAINTINHEGETITVAYVTGVDVKNRLKGTVIPLVGTLVGEVVRTRKSVVIQAEDPKKVTDRLPGLLMTFQAGIRSLMALPLISKDEVVGTLHFHSTKPNAYREKDLRLAEEVSHQIAGAIANAQLFIERKLAEEALALNEERYRTLVEESFDGIYIRKGPKIVFANRRLYEMLGYEEGKLEGLDHWLVYHPDYQALIRERAQARMRGESIPSTYEIKFLRKDGSSFWGEIHAKVINIFEEPRVQVWARDIGERKQAEETLRAERERFRSLSESAPFGMAMIDKDGLFKYINSKLKELLGYDLNDIPDGKTWFRKTCPDSDYRHQVISAWLEDSASSTPGEKMPRVFTVKCKDGSEKIIHFITVKLETGENLMACEDITERKRAEEALRESEERYRTILESIEEGYYEVDLSGNFTFFNDSLRRSLGYSKEELMGMNNRQYTDPENAKKLFQVFKEVYRTQKPGSVFDHEIIRKDGTKRCAEGSIVLQKDSSGHPIGFRGIVRDITERKQFERVLQQERETFFSILQKQPYGALLIDTDETFLYINPEFTAITGYTIKDVPNGREWFRKTYPDPEYRHKVIATWKEDITPHKAIDRVWSVVCKGGEIKEIEFKLTFLDDGRIIVMLSDITERKRTEEELAYRATHDLLTGLPNRMLFKDRFSVAMAQAQRVRKKVGVIFLDLDRFKEVNDMLGHDAGDRLLCAVGNRLMELLRKTDTVARMGGDEFLLLLPNIEQGEDVINTSQTVLNILREPFIVDGHEVSISASIGISIYPDDGTDVDTLVSRADKAMYDSRQREGGT